MEHIHSVIISTQVLVDERRATGGSCDYVHAPVGIGIFVRFQLVADVAVQVLLGVQVEGESHAFQYFGKFGEGNGWFFFGSVHDVKGVDVPHVGDLSDGLIGESGEHPPYTSFLIFKERQEFFTVDGQSNTLFVLLFRPDLDIVAGYFPLS